jgi:redox-sensitive bicupin YhaK (pirin superfamily)
MSLEDIDDLPLDLEATTLTRSVDRSAMLHEGSEGFGHKSRKLTTGAGPLDPFLRLEEIWMSEPVLPPTPLAGTMTVSYVLEDSESSLMIRDSIGCEHLVAPGALFLMNVGRGLVVEQTPAQYGRTVHFVNLDVNLSGADKDSQASKLEVPAPAVREFVKGSVVRARVLAGECNGTQARFMPGTPFSFVELHLSPGASLRHVIPRDHTAFVVVLKGKALVGNDEDPRSVRAGVAVSLFDDGDSVLIRAADEKCHALLASAKPLAEPVFTDRGYVMNHPTELADADARFENGDMGLLLPRE